MNYDTWKFTDYRSEETECPTHGTFYTSEICPDCDADDAHKSLRIRKAQHIRRTRERARTARIYEGFLTNRQQILSVGDRVKIAFASPEFMRSEVDWLKGDI